MNLRNYNEEQIMPTIYDEDSDIDFDLQDSLEELHFDEIDMEWEE